MDISYEGHFDLSEAQQFYAQIAEQSAQLRKGFILVTDLTLLEQMELNACPYIEKAMDVLNTAGVSKVVRIIPDQGKDIGLTIMSLFHYSSRVAVHTFKTHSEAECYVHKK